MFNFQKYENISDDKFYFQPRDFGAAVTTQLNYEAEDP